MLFSSQDPDNIIRTNHSNYARDGIMTMDTQSHINFFVRSMLLMVRLLCRQLPTHYNVHIDKDVFLSAFSARPVADGVFQPSPWNLGPDGSVHSAPNPCSPREIARREYFHGLYGHLAPAIPSVPNVHPSLKSSTPGQGNKGSFEFLPVRRFEANLRSPP